MIENRESDDERACCVLSLSLSLSCVVFLFFSFSSCSYEKRKREKKVTNRQKSFLRFFFASPPQKFHRAHTTRITRITQTHIHIVRLWFRKENRITIGILTIVV